jgi:hypothetical protein
MNITREPAVWIGIVSSMFASAAAVGLPFLNAGQAAAAVAVLAAAFTAWRTRPIAPALFTGAFAALVALLAEYQVHLSDGWVGFITSAILGGFALFGIRPQVVPVSGGTIVEGQRITSATVGV